MIRRSHFFLFFLAAMLNISGAFADCSQLEGSRISELDRYFVDVRELKNAKIMRHVEPLKTVYVRIASAALIRPALVICEDDKLNAEAIAVAGAEGFVVFYLPMLEMLDVNTDEIAAVMAHEFAHLLLDHSNLKKTAYSILTTWAKTIAWDRYQRFGNADSAIQSAFTFRKIELMKFSRSVEREADDKGFSLAVTLAKFNGEGFKRVATKLSQLPASNQPPYLSSHPGWLERIEKADLLTLNQHFMDTAHTLFSIQNWAALSSHVKNWLHQIPESGAAWYYKGRLLTRTSRNPSRITTAFEEAARHYINNPVLGVKSQEDQAEVDAVWFYLCLALFDEGYKFESANCSRHLTTELAREKFQANTFRGLLIVGGTEQPAGNLLVARQPDGSKLLTNDQSIAASRGAYRPISPVWRAIRYPENMPR